MSLVCVLDQDARILFFNDACERVDRFLARRGGRIVTHATSSFLPRSPRPSARCSSTSGSTGLSSPQVGHWLTKDGQRKLIAWSNRLMPRENGGPPLLVTAGIDLSGSTPSGTDEAFEGDPEAKLAEVGRLAQEQRALRRVATLVASEASPERVFTAVSEEAARVLEVNASAVFRYEGDDTATIVGRHSRVERRRCVHARAAPARHRGHRHRPGAQNRGTCADPRLLENDRRDRGQHETDELPVVGVSPDRRRRHHLGRRRYRERRAAPGRYARPGWAPSASSCRWRWRARRRART